MTLIWSCRRLGIAAGRMGRASHNSTVWFRLVIVVCGQPILQFSWWSPARHHRHVWINSWGWLEFEDPWEEQLCLGHQNCSKRCTQHLLHLVSTKDPHQELYIIQHWYDTSQTQDFCFEVSSIKVKFNYPATCYSNYRQVPMLQTPQLQGNTAALQNWFKLPSPSNSKMAP